MQFQEMVRRGLSALEGDEGFDPRGIRLETIVCDGCDGTGITWGGMTLTAQDFYEDPDLGDSVREGVYDRPCEDCGGARVVRDVNWSDSDPVAAGLLILEMEVIAANDREG